MQILFDVLHLLMEVVLAYLMLFYRIFVPKKPKNVSGEIALVTGAGRGIGREICLQLSRLNVTIVAWDINGALLKETAKLVKQQGGGSISTYLCDVSDRDHVAKVASKVRSEVGDITILVNNAGILHARPFLDFEDDEIEKIFRVNTFSQIWTFKEFLPEFYRRDKGHVVSMCSVAGVAGTPYLSTYCSSKFAIKGLMETIFLEQRKDRPKSNVKLTSIHPFTVNTGLTTNPTTQFPSLIPIVEPQECARIVVEAMRLDEEIAFVPRRLKYFFAIQKIFPLRVQLAVFDFLDCGVGY